MGDLPLPPLRDVIAEYGLDARKGLGQHFLLDANLTDRIARAAGDLRAMTVLEIGPGPGGLTRSLLETGADRVIAVEKDRRCLAALHALKSHHPDRLTVVPGDALKIDEAALVSANTAVVANLPYNVATPLLFKWLDGSVRYERLILMFQKEVADRLVASPGGKTYGRLSVMAQYACAVRPLFDVHPRAFTPPPSVWSSVVELVPRILTTEDPLWRPLGRLVQAAFGQRRKMLRTALKPVIDDPVAALTAADIDPTSRAETLSVEAFVRLTSCELSIGCSLDPALRS